MASRIAASSVAGVGPRTTWAVVAEDDDRDAVVAAEPVDEDPQRLLDDLEPAVLLHRAGRVDDERERRLLALAVRDGPRLEADPEEDLVVVA